MSCRDGSSSASIGTRPCSSGCASRKSSNARKPADDVLRRVGAVDPEDELLGPRLARSARSSDDRPGCVASASNSCRVDRDRARRARRGRPSWCDFAAGDVDLGARRSPRSFAGSSAASGRCGSRRRRSRARLRARPGGRPRAARASSPAAATGCGRSGRARVRAPAHGRSRGATIQVVVVEEDRRRRARARARQHRLGEVLVDGPVAVLPRVVQPVIDRRASAQVPEVVLDEPERSGSRRRCSSSRTPGSWCDEPQPVGRPVARRSSIASPPWRSADQPVARRSSRSRSRSPRGASPGRAAPSRARRRRGAHGSRRRADCVRDRATVRHDDQLAPGRHRPGHPRGDWRNVARRRGAMLVPRLGRRERSYACHTGATEDDASGRAARPCGSDVVSPSPSAPRPA